MLIIIDSRIPLKAMDNLSKYGELIEFSTEGITYDAISCHPDIFFCKIGDTLVIPPNLPDNYIKILKDHNIKYHCGKSFIGKEYPSSACYNAAVSVNFFVHKLEITDRTLINLAENCEKINVSQGYARCSLLPLGGKYFLTSDYGIFDALNKKGLKSLYINPVQIKIPGKHNFKNGLLGGTCGVYEDKVFFIGNIDSIKDKAEACSFIKKAGFEIVTLYDGPLVDGGSIIFIDRPE